MAEHQWGGYRKPSNPSPISGPGKYSRRTDGGPAQVASTIGDQPYGQASADLAAQRMVPMGAATPLPHAASVPAGPQGSGGPVPPGPDFGAPSDRPDEPTTHGVDIGDGDGPEVLGLPQPSMPDGYLTNTLSQLSASDTTGALASLYVMAQQRGI